MLQADQLFCALSLPQRSFPATLPIWKIHTPTRGPRAECVLASFCQGWRGGEGAEPQKILAKGLWGFHMVALE